MDKYAPTLHKGKRTDNGDWVVGYYVHLIDSVKGRESHRIYDGYAETDCAEFYPNFFEIDPETLETCIGFHDKDGTLIFTNDVISSKAMQNRLFIVRKRQSDGAFSLRSAEYPDSTAFEITFNFSSNKDNDGDPRILPPDEPYPTIDSLTDMGSIHDVDLKLLLR